MTLSNEEQSVLNAICVSGGGIDIHDLTEQTGLDYEQITNIVRRLVSKGYQIRGLSVGGNHRVFDSWVKRYYLSPYDPKYNNLIKEEI